MSSKSSFLAPSPSLCAKLGSIAVHAEELASSNGHHFDRLALAGLLEDAEVAAWIADGRKMAMVPEKRETR